VLFPAQARRNAEIVKKEGVGSKAKAKLVEDLQGKEQERQRLESEKASFQASLLQAANPKNPPSEAVLKANAERMEEFKAREAELARGEENTKRDLLGLRKQEVAKQNKMRDEYAQAIHGRTVGKIPFSFIAGGGTGGGGGGGGGDGTSPQHTRTFTQSSRWAPLDDGEDA